MNKDVMTIITMTFAIIIIAWVLFNYQAVNSIAQGASGAYTNTVTSLVKAGKG